MSAVNIRDDQEFFRPPPGYGPRKTLGEMKQIPRQKKKAHRKVRRGIRDERCKIDRRGMTSAAKSPDITRIFEMLPEDYELTSSPHAFDLEESDLVESLSSKQQSFLGKASCSPSPVHFQGEHIKTYSKNMKQTTEFEASPPGVNLKGESKLRSEENRQSNLRNPLGDLDLPHMYIPGDQNQSTFPNNKQEGLVYIPKQKNANQRCVEDYDVGLLQNNIISARMKMSRKREVVMDMFMLKLLKSLKDFMMRHGDDEKSGENQGRLKLTRIIQILMLQRRNLQTQNDDLGQGIRELMSKNIELRNNSDNVILENADLRKRLDQLQSEDERKDMRIKGLKSNEENLVQQIADHSSLNIEFKDMEFELKKLVYENENLKDVTSQLDIILKSKIEENARHESEISKLTQELNITRSEITHLNLRYDRLLSENHSLCQSTASAQNGLTKNSPMVIELDRLKIQLSALTEKYLRLKNLYLLESDTRKLLHNQLQEVRGNIRVLCRVRPPTASGINVFEYHSTDKLIIPGSQMPSYIAYQRQLTPEQPSALLPKDECFIFNRIFRENSTQLDIFNEVRPLIASAVDGHNVCFMAYGPTGTGKTFSMQGTSAEPGISPRAIEEMFELCNLLRGVCDCEIKLSMLEIHNEVIYDLLAECIRPIRLCDDGVDVYLLEVEEKLTSCEAEALHWIARGQRKRKMSSTKLNSESSRSHLVVRLSISIKCKLTDEERHSSLLFCDLAGSESAERIEAVGGMQVETGYINRSLATLGRIFEALRQRSNNMTCGSKSMSAVINTHSGNTATSNLTPTNLLASTTAMRQLTPPYRESKLTHLLKPCLGGQAKCVLIITASGDPTNLDRSVKALEFGQKAMRIALGRPPTNRRILASRGVANKHHEAG
ncbi:unnamed protein product [Protopolystoma xenopodis]|uniref:Kinesin-like protein n=1 Tax=Protopolystoma xenopodis TaxID=117903 RepID=A0A3S5CMS1_9PLAT|nr:unnamed protein product [Protopolystoma xenopodis]